MTEYETIQDAPKKGLLFSIAGDGRGVALYENKKSIAKLDYAYVDFPHEDKRFPDYAYPPTWKKAKVGWSRGYAKSEPFVLAANMITSLSCGDASEADFIASIMQAAYEHCLGREGILAPLKADATIREVDSATWDLGRHLDAYLVRVKRLARDVIREADRREEDENAAGVRLALESYSEYCEALTKLNIAATLFTSGGNTIRYQAGTFNKKYCTKEEVQL